MNSVCKMSYLFSLLRDCELSIPEDFAVIGDDIIIRDKTKVTDFFREGLHKLFLKGKVKGREFIITVK